MTQNESIVDQTSKVRDTIRNITEQLIDSDVPENMTLSEYVFSYFEASYLKIIDPMVEVIVDEYVTVHQIESIIYGLGQRTNSTSAQEIFDTINKTYGRELV